MKPILRVWQIYYCESDWKKCKRYRLSQAGEKVPTNLLPSGRMLELPLEQVEPERTS